MNENDVDRATKVVAENEMSVITLLKEKGEGKVTLERKKVMPERMESPARQHTFHDVEGFTKYITANVSENTIVFADVDGVIIKAVLDDKAEFGKEIIMLSPPYHPAFTLLEEALLNKTLRIADFAQGVMRNRAIIQGTDQCDAQSLALSMQQLTVATAVVQAIGDGKKSTNGVMTTTSVTTGCPEADEHLELPDSIVVKVPIYLNTEPVLFAINITISTRSGDVLATTDSPELALKEYEVFEKMMKDLRAIDKVSVVYGVPCEADWKYNK